MGVAEELDEWEEEYGTQVAELEQEVSRLKLALTDKKQKPEDDVCETDGCKRNIDWFCKFCHQSICQKCSKTVCSVNSTHSLIEFDTLYQECSTKYKTWNDKMQASVKNLESQQTQLTADVSSSFQRVQQMSASPSDLASPDMVELMKDLSKKQELLGQVNKELMTVKSKTSSFGENVEALSKTDFLKVFVKQNLADRKQRQITLGECRVTTPGRCYYVSKTPTGQLLVGRKRGFDICSNDGSIVKSISVTEGSIYCIQNYDSKIYTLCLQPQTGGKRNVIVFDNITYRETGRWSVPNCSYLGNIAVSNNKVYVTDYDKSNLCVYSVTGSLITRIQHPDFKTPSYLSSSAPDSVIMCDDKANKVYKLNSKDDTITWTCAEVPWPAGVCSDTNGNVWVWSEKTKSIFLLSSESGKVIQELSYTLCADIPASSDSRFFSLCVTSQSKTVVTATLDAGLLQFDIK